MGEEEKKLFVGRLPGDIVEEEIRMVFNTYGKVMDVRIFDKGPQKSAFVTYDTKYAADVAIQVLNNIYRFREGARDPVHVSRARHARSYPDRDGRDDKYSSNRPTFSDERGRYDRGSYSYGDHDHDRGRGDNRGYGYGSERTSLVSRGDDRYNGSSGKGGPPGTKLYVSNLPSDITREALEYVFRTYGSIHDIHIMTGRSNSRQGCAFICYSTIEDARRCIAAMQRGYEIRPGEGDIVVKFADDQRPPGSGARYRPY